MQLSTQSALTQHMSTSVGKTGVLEVPVTQTIVSLLQAIMEHMEDLKGSSANKILRFWPSQFCQFGTYVTKIS